MSNSPGASPTPKVRRSNGSNSKKSATKADSAPSSPSSEAAAAASEPASSPTSEERRMVKRQLQFPPGESRTLYHVRTSLPITHGEPEAEESYQWLTDLSLRQIDEFVDLNEGEKALMKMWNAYSFLHPCYGDRMMPALLHGFVRQHAKDIMNRNLYYNFVLHVYNLVDFGIINTAQAYAVTCRLQRRMVDCGGDDEDEDEEAWARPEDSTAASAAGRAAMDAEEAAGSANSRKRKRKKSSTPENSPKRKMKRRSCTRRDTAAPMDTSYIVNEGADFAAAAFKAVVAATATTERNPSKRNPAAATSVEMMKKASPRTLRGQQ